MLIEHDLELVGRLCHRVTVINQGHHVFTGTPAAAQNDPEVVRAYLGMNQLISGGADDARVENLHAAYGEIEVLHGVNLAVEKGQIVALLGANGAGKSTTIKAIMGLVKPSAGGSCSTAAISPGQAAHLAARAGIALVPEGRKIFKKMTVEENLQVGGVVRSAAEVRSNSPTSMRCFRGWPSAAVRSAARCRAASSRCSRSAAR